MRNKKVLSVALLSFTWFLSACSSGDREYSKLMTEADKAMESLDVETVIARYRKITEMDPKKFEYGEGRIVIVNELLEDAEKLKEKIAKLKSRAEKVKQTLGELNIEKAKVEEVTQVYGELNDIHSGLKPFPTTGLYKELDELRNKFANDIKTGKIDPLIKEIEDNISKSAFDKAESNVTVLRKFEGSFSGLVGNAAENKSAMIKAEKAKYIDFPVTYNQRDVVLLENSAGKITFLGEGVKNNRLALFYKYGGSMRFAADELPPKIQAVFSDGKSATSEKMTLRHFPDYAVGFQNVSDDPKKTLVRLDYRFGLQRNEEYAKVDIAPAGKTEILKEVLAFPDKEFQSSIKAANDRVTVEINWC